MIHPRAAAWAVALVLAWPTLAASTADGPRATRAFEPFYQDEAEDAGVGLRPHFFPLFHAERDRVDGADEVTAVWPLFLWLAGGATTDTLTALRPLFSTGSTSGGLEAFTDVLFPIAGTRRRTDPDGDYSAWQWLLPIYYQKESHDDRLGGQRRFIFPFWYSGRRRPPDAGYRILFPFLWDIDEGASYYFPLWHRDAGRSWAFWPFYGVFRNLFGTDRLDFWLWPLYIRTLDGPHTGHTVLWPVFNRTIGPERGELRFWPLFRRRTRKDVGYRFNYLWPLGYHYREQRASGRDVSIDALLPLFARVDMGNYRLRYYFPVYGRTEQPKVNTTAWFWPLWSRTRHIEPDWDQFNVLWIVLIRQWGDEGYSRFQLFPLYGDRHRPARRERFMLWPIYRGYHEVKSTGETFDRAYLIPLFINQQWISPEGEIEKQHQALLPLYRRVARRDGSVDFSAPHLWWFTDNAGLVRNWSPLWTLYQSHDDGAGTVERRVFWRLWRQRSVEGAGREYELNLLLLRWHRRLDGTHRWGLCGLEFGG